MRDEAPEAGIKWQRCHYSFTYYQWRRLHFTLNPVSRKTSLPPFPIQESADVDTHRPLKNKQPDNSRVESDCTTVDSPADRHDTADSPLEVGDAGTG